jgi:hypothetical protein
VCLTPAGENFLNEVTPDINQLRRANDHQEGDGVPSAAMRAAFDLRGVWNRNYCDSFRHVAKKSVKSVIKNGDGTRKESACN